MELSAMTNEQLEAKLAELSGAYENEKGDTAEVYSRIVGYYRSVRNWNDGKKKEFGERAVYAVSGGEECDCVAQKVTKTEAIASNDLFAQTSATAVSYRFFYRDTCPNCVPVKAFLGELNMKGEAVNVDEKSGLALAVSAGIFAAPTVVFYDAKGEEVFRSSRREELESFVADVAA